MADRRSLVPGRQRLVRGAVAPAARQTRFTSHRSKRDEAPTALSGNTGHMCHER